MLSSPRERVRIYQLFVRLFSNTNETRKPNGTLAENGVGKFNDIHATALASLKEMGFTHLWFTGVLQQATATDYSGIGEPADDPDLLKGLAGSPYAIKDYFDVCPDYATNPANRMAEFRELISRIHSAGMKTLIDFVPNHVARCYASDVRPELDFGRNDDRTQFFHPANNFYYLAPDSNGPPLRLPTIRDGRPVSPTCLVPGMQCDGLFAGEKAFGRVTGNNAATWRPSIYDWYETVKLNYGWDFLAHRRAFPDADRPDAPIPDTWTKMDAVIAYWQEAGVDGFRCDMSHMIPCDFWKWEIANARRRNPDVYFMAEAYDNDPAKIPSPNNIMRDLLDAGFDAVYDDPSYKTLKKIYDGPGWANDIDWAVNDPTIFENSLHYAENHDEVRLASEGNWGNIGMQVGRAVSGILYGLSCGPVMLYNGQEVGEAANGIAGFGGGNGRTSIFDYWSMPEMTKWVNGHRYDGGSLSSEQKDLREFYKKLLLLVGEPAFRDGRFHPLNPSNNSNLQFGSVPGDSAGGHWVYAYMRHDRASNQRFLVVVNLHREIIFQNVRVNIPAAALDLPPAAQDQVLRLDERLFGNMRLQKNCSEFAADSHLEIPEIPPLTPYYFEVTLA